MQVNHDLDELKFLEKILVNRNEMSSPEVISVAAETGIIHELFGFKNVQNIRTA